MQALAGMYPRQEACRVILASGSDNAARLGDYVVALDPQPLVRIYT